MSCLESDSEGYFLFDRSKVFQPAQTLNVDILTHAFDPTEMCIHHYFRTSDPCR